MFLYGMRLMGNGLKESSSGTLKKALEKVTRTPFTAFLMGLGMTAVTETDMGFCYGVVANVDFILICTYGKGGSDPKLVMYKKR